MIQRVQTLFLLLCAICFGSFFVLPLKEITVDGSLRSINAISPFKGDFAYTLSFDIICGFIFLGTSASILSIFAYKQRYLQVRFCIILITLATVCLLLLDLSSSVEFYGNFEKVPIHANVLLALIIPLAYLAMVFIKRDIKLLKSINRIR